VLGFRTFRELIFTVIMNEKVREEIQRKTKNNRLPCSVAREIARDLSVSLKDVGKAADELNVKITDCELGCF
jgi:hypothetical protein